MEWFIGVKTLNHSHEIIVIDSSNLICVAQRGWL